MDNENVCLFLRKLFASHTWLNKNEFSESLAFSRSCALAPGVAAEVAVIYFVSSSGYPLAEPNENPIAETSVRGKSVISETPKGEPIGGMGS